MTGGAGVWTMGRTVTAAEAVKALEAAGFVQVAFKGSHKKMRHPDGPTTTVPMHRGELKIGTIKAIEKQTQTKLTE